MKLFAMAVVCVFLYDVAAVPFFSHFHKNYKKAAPLYKLERQRKAVSGTVESRCEAFYESIQSMVDQLQAAGVDLNEGIGSIAGMGGTNLDFSDPAVLREAACELAAIESLEDMAVANNIPVDMLRKEWPVYLMTMRQMMVQMEMIANMDGMPDQARRMAQSVVDFFQLYESFGYFDLQ